MKFQLFTHFAPRAMKNEKCFQIKKIDEYLSAAIVQLAQI